MSLPPYRYEIMLKCWEDEADKRPTFTEIVSQYHDRLISVTSKVQQGGHGSYVLLGPEEDRVELKKFNDTSVMDISMISKDSNISTPSAGMTFDVTFLSPRSGGAPGATDLKQDVECDDNITVATPDQECYIEMNSVSGYQCLGGTSVHVLVNQAALDLHECDDVAHNDPGAGASYRARVRGEQDGHMITASDHVTSGLNYCPTHAVHSNGSHKLKTSTSDYIIMQAAASASS